MAKTPKTTARRAKPELAPDEVADLVTEAERGYDVDQILRRRGGRPAIGSSAASVESVRLDPKLKRDLLLRAAEDNTSVSDVIRRAIGAYLEAG